MPLQPPGSIPARAGEPQPRLGRCGSRWVYPRTGGGTDYGSLMNELGQGLSPHGRGNRGARNRGRRRVGSIPARAGEPSSRRSLDRHRGVYPRTGGGTAIYCVECVYFRGLSPHGRGNLERAGQDRDPPGSIPARAGEPGSVRDAPGREEVYPRTGGGTLTTEASGNREKGLSPHGRGTQWAKARYPAGQGLSPHGRGNLERAGQDRDPPGSIPARAGEPGSPS